MYTAPDIGGGAVRCFQRRSARHCPPAGHAQRHQEGRDVVAVQLRVALGGGGGAGSRTLGERLVVTIVDDILRYVELFVFSSYVQLEEELLLLLLSTGYSALDTPVDTPPDSIF